MKCSRKKHLPCGVRSAPSGESIGRTSVTDCSATTISTKNQTRIPTSEMTRPLSFAHNNGLCAKYTATAASAHEKNMMNPTDSVDTENSHMIGESAASRQPSTAIGTSPKDKSLFGDSLHPPRAENT